MDSINIDFKDYNEYPNMPGTPDNALTLGKSTDAADCLLIIYPIGNTRYMIDATNEGMINGIHSALGNEQGLVELDKGKSFNRNLYAYTLIKNRLGPKGTQYILTFHILIDNEVVNVQGFFNEKGAFGSREGVVMTKLASENKISTSTLDGWKIDPYNVNYKKGYLMNLSERKDYDEMFPNHPLSEARSVLTYLIEEN